MSNKQNIKLQDASYISLSTQKKSGAWVATPVWFTLQGDSIFIFSAADAGKVKRLKNFPAAKVAPCSVNGKVCGDWHDVNGCILDKESDQQAAHKALVDEYGWQMKILDFFSGLFKRKEARAFITLKLT